MARTARLTPVELAPAPWPDVPATDPYAEVARQFTLCLREERAGRSLRVVADLTGIHHVTLLKILAGRTWPDLATIARLEIGLGADLFSSAAVRQRLQADS